MDYTFSFYHTVDSVNIKHPKWWQFWKKAELVWTKHQERKVVCIQLDKYDFLEDNDFKELLLSLFTGLHSMRLEQHMIHTGYIETRGAFTFNPTFTDNKNWYVENTTTNLLKNSEINKLR
jgi:hypothetical protein